MTVCSPAKVSFSIRFRISPKPLGSPKFSATPYWSNGKLFPYLEVEPRNYRLRLLNASNGRFYHLSFSSGLRFHQIGTDQGLLEAPVPLSSLALAPAERADLIVDFSAARGEQIVLKNDAGVVMQFRVSGNPAEDPSSLPAVLRTVPRIPEAEAVKTLLTDAR